MQLLLAIVQDEDSDTLCRRLNRSGHRVTRIRSRGGFLNAGNTTVMLGVKDPEVDEVVALIRQTCQARRTLANPLPWGHEAVQMTLAAAVPLEVEVGGATIFTVPVRRFLRLRGAPVPPSADEHFAAQPTLAHEDQTDLVVAIVRWGDADRVSDAIIQAGFRLTRIPTVGAFLRRPNVTLLCAAARHEVDRLLAVLQENCKFRSEAEARSGEMPLFAATVFVVELAKVIALP